MGGGGGGMGGGGGGMGGGGAEMQAMFRAYQLSFIIQQTVEPDSWYNVGGRGEIYPFAGIRLVVYQTLDVHQKIRKLLDALEVFFGDQVAIEARFLLVDENFLEDIGLDTNISLSFGDRWNEGGAIALNQSSYEAVLPGKTKISSSLGLASGSNAALRVGPVTWLPSGLLDDLSVSFILRATQMHANSKILTEPKLMVLNGESAFISISQTRNYVSNVSFNSEVVSVGVSYTTTVSYWTTEVGQIGTGLIVSITPIITFDKKYVILNITAFLNDQLSSGANAGEVQGLVGPTVVTAYFDLPEIQNTSVMTRVTVPDQGTILLGGLTLTAEKELESGVPVLSKIPILGRLFSNRSEVKDKQILLILVKPTIILEDEVEEKAIAAME
jgi:type II secretory pathway component GspD/PulD (secretin)